MIAEVATLPKQQQECQVAQQVSNGMEANSHCQSFMYLHWCGVLTALAEPFAGAAHAAVSRTFKAGSLHLGSSLHAAPAFPSQ
jgi:hypothetical protein